MTVRNVTFGVPEDAFMYAVFERIEMIHGADGKYYITDKIERGRFVPLTKIGDVALARNYVTALNALLKMYHKELGIDE
jgi:hypothetical protein